MLLSRTPAVQARPSCTCWQPSSSKVGPTRPPGNLAGPRGAPLRTCRASERDSQQAGPSSSTTEADLEEQRIEALEAATKRARSTRRQIPIRGMTPPAQQQQQRSGNRAVWKEGKLLPEGWEEMDPAQKATELYLGERGILYWATQAAWYSILILAGAWIVFRFVGPNLGLYQLATDITPPTL